MVIKLVIKVNAKTKAALVILSGAVLTAVGTAVQPLVGLGVISPVVGAVIGISIPVAITEVDTGKVSVQQLEEYGSELITALSKSGKLTATEQEAAAIAQTALSAIQSTQSTTTPSAATDFKPIVSH